jgi:hypothetical protein
MSLHTDETDTDFVHTPYNQTIFSAWTRIPDHTDAWRITRDTEVQFADGFTALWAVDPTIGFYDIDLGVLKHRPVRMRQAQRERTRTRDFLPY